MNLQNINPIILREMRSRMRTRKTFIGLTWTAILCAGLAGIIYVGFYESATNGQVSYNLATPSIELGPYIGKAIFSTIVLLMLGFLPFLAASLASDSIVGEKERQTYEMLRITALPTRHIVLGKLGAVFSFLLLHILVALPLLSLAFLFGGVAFSEVMIAILGLLVTAVAFGALGVYISSLTRTLKMATALSGSLILFGLYAIPGILWAIFVIGPLLIGPTINSPADLPAYYYLLLVYVGGFAISVNPLGAAIATGVAAASGMGYFFVSVPGPPFTVWGLSPWLVYVLFYSFLTWLLVLLTTRRLDKVSKI